MSWNTVVGTSIGAFLAGVGALLGKRSYQRKAPEDVMSVEVGTARELNAMLRADFVTMRDDFAAFRAKSEARDEQCRRDIAALTWSLRAANEEIVRLGGNPDHLRNETPE